jgi:hypothetical protein
MCLWLSIVRFVFGRRLLFEQHGVWFENLSSSILDSERCCPLSAHTTTTTTHSSIPNAGCPTGYYACSAYYPGGCCQIGRDCSQTSCPTSASTTLVNSNGLTIIAPSGSGITRNPAGLTGTCASGWSTCAATYGGGCCPNGYGCGTSCTATASGGQGNVVGKIAPNSAMKICAWKNLWFAWVGTLAMMLYPLVR